MAVRPTAVQKKRQSEITSIFAGVRQDRREREQHARQQKREEQARRQEQRQADAASWEARQELLQKRIVVLKVSDPRFDAFYAAFDRARGTFAAEFIKERGEWRFAVIARDKVK